MLLDLKVLNHKDQREASSLEAEGREARPGAHNLRAALPLALDNPPPSMSPVPTALPRPGLVMLTPLFGPPGSEDYRSRFSSECFMDLVCPDRCRCEGTIVDCSNQKLARIPSHLPEYVTDL